MTTSDWIACAAVVVALWTRWQSAVAIRAAGGGASGAYNLGRYKTVEGWAVMVLLDDGSSGVHQPLNTKVVLCLSEGEALGVATKLADQEKNVLVCAARHVTI